MIYYNDVCAYTLSQDLKFGLSRTTTLFQIGLKIWGFIAPSGIHMQEQSRESFQQQPQWPETCTLFPQNGRYLIIFIIIINLCKIK